MKKISMHLRLQTRLQTLLPMSAFALLVLLSQRVQAAEAPIIPPPPPIAASSYLLIDADTQKVLIENNSHEALPPASLTKIMTGYVAAVEMEAGRLQPDAQVDISVAAWQTPGSRMFIQEGTRVSVSDLMKGIIIQSGNDASVAIAEHIAGSEGAFADMMNQQAVRLGMHTTQFQNATGLPAEGHYTSAWDLALLTRSLIKDFPESYAIYAERSFKFNDIEQPNRNRLLWRDRSVDGVKTGHTNEAGYCLVASAVRDNMRLISVVMGTDSDESRVRESQKLLSYGFRYFETQSLYEASVPLKTVQVWYGEDEQLALGVDSEVVLTMPRGHYGDVAAEMIVEKQVEAPINQGDQIGELVLTLYNEELYRAPLVALSAVEEAGWFSQAGDFLSLFFKNLFSSD
jgi:D-alanyl-D-alanine carboxypeptidase (penicillin-binding protein 5/6)